MCWSFTAQVKLSCMHVIAQSACIILMSPCDAVSGYKQWPAQFWRNFRAVMALLSLRIIIRCNTLYNETRNQTVQARKFVCWTTFINSYCHLNSSCWRLVPPTPPLDRASRAMWASPSFSSRLTMKLLVSMNLSTQLAIHVSVRRSSFWPGAPVTHVSQHSLVNEWISCWKRCFCVSPSTKRCIWGSSIVKSQYDVIVLTLVTVKVYNVDVVQYSLLFFASYQAKIE